MRDEIPYNLTKEETTLDPLNLDPDHEKREEIRLLEPFADVVANVNDARLMIQAMQAQIAAQEARVKAAGLTLDNLVLKPRKSNIDIEVPPCLSTREGQELFRQQLQPWRVVLRNGGWALLSARVVCEVSYWAGRSITGLGLREAWRLARVR